MAKNLSALFGDTNVHVILMHIAEIQKKVNLNFYGKDGAPSPDHIPQPSATVTACICCHLTH